MEEFFLESLECTEESEKYYNAYSCLLINKAYQEQLEDFINLISEKLNENKEKQNYLNNKLNKQNFSIKLAYSFSSFITPYFCDNKGLHPPPNEDTIQKQKNGELNLNYTGLTKKWNPVDENCLMTAINELYVKDKLEDLRKKKENLLIDLKLNETSKFLSKNLKEEIHKCDILINNCLKESLENIISDKNFNIKIDWLYVSKLLDNVHSDLNCKLYWENWLHPLINKKEWSVEETEKLNEITKNVKFFNWDKIASSLNANRKAWQVAKYYQITFNVDIKRNGSFNEGEIKLLKKVVDQCRIGDYIPWNQVNYFFDGRSKSQLKNFWISNYEFKTKGYWSLLEDIVLYVAYQCFDANWKIISLYLPGRTNRQCRERFVNSLALSNKRFGKWKPSEDKKLIGLYDKMGSNWVEISKILGNRSINQVKGRLKVLKKNLAKKSLVKRNKKFNLEERRLNYIIEKSNKIVNIKSFLFRSRLLLSKESYEKKNTEKKDLIFIEKQKPKKKISNEQEEEEEIDNEILKLFMHYNLLPTTFKVKPSCTSVDNAYINDVLIKNLNEFLNGSKCKDNYLLNNVIRYLFKNEITDYSNLYQKNSLNIPPILPPNKTTMLAFFGVLLQKIIIEKKVEESPDFINNFDFDVLKNDVEFKKLSNIFFSLFYWPALMTDIDLPKKDEVNSNENNQCLKITEEAEKKSIKFEKTAKRSIDDVKELRKKKAMLITKIRVHQNELIDSVKKFKDS